MKKYIRGGIGDDRIARGECVTSGAVLHGSAGVISRSLVAQVIMRVNEDIGTLPGDVVDGLIKKRLVPIKLCATPSQAYGCQAGEIGRIEGPRQTGRRGAHALHQEPVATSSVRHQGKFLEIELDLRNTESVEAKAREVVDGRRRRPRVAKEGQPR